MSFLFIASFYMIGDTASELVMGIHKALLKEVFFNSSKTWAA